MKFHEMSGTQSVWLRSRLGEASNLKIFKNPILAVWQMVQTTISLGFGKFGLSSELELRKVGTIGFPAISVHVPQLIMRK